MKEYRPYELYSIARCDFVILERNSYYDDWSFFKENGKIAVFDKSKQRNAKMRVLTYRAIKEDSLKTVN